MKKLFHMLLPYLNKKYYPGAGIRWIITDRREGKLKGRAVYCLFCGNYANGVGHIKLMNQHFNIPVCKTHISSYLDKHTPADKQWEFIAPGIINMNIKCLVPL